MKSGTWLFKYMTKRELAQMDKEAGDDHWGWTYEQAKEFMGKHQANAVKRWEKTLEKII